MNIGLSFKNIAAVKTEDNPCLAYERIMKIVAGTAGTAGTPAEP
jgi:ribosomal protein L11